MLCIRIVSASALAAIAVALTVNIAAAQSSDSVALAGLHPPHTVKTYAHAKPAHRKIARFERKHLAKRDHAIAAIESEAPAKTPVHDNAWPTPPQSAPDNTVAAAPAQPTLAPVALAMPTDPAPPPPAAQVASSAISDATPNAVVMNGQTVEIASPDYLNAIDRAAGDNRDAATEPTAQSVFAAPVHGDASRVGSASWIAQVLAALGGAMAAGVAAWFMIGPNLQRMFG